MDSLENDVSCLPASMEDKSKKRLPFHCGAFIRKITKNRPSFSSKFNCECLFDDFGVTYLFGNSVSPSLEQELNVNH